MTDEALRPESAEVIQALVDNHRRFVAFLERRVGDRAQAEEILQAAFVRTLEKGSALPHPDGAVAWMYRVLRNALVDHYRRSAAQGRALDAVSQEPDVSSEDPELRAAVCSCIHDLIPTLKPEYGDLIQRVDLGDRSIAEVAQAAGITSNNATVRLYRARQALKKQLQRSCGSCATHGCLDCTCAGTTSGQRRDPSGGAGPEA